MAESAMRRYAPTVRRRRSTRVLTRTSRPGCASRTTRTRCPGEPRARFETLVPSATRRRSWSPMVRRFRMSSSMTCWRSSQLRRRGHGRRPQGAAPLRKRAGPDRHLCVQPGGPRRCSHYRVLRHPGEPDPATAPIGPSRASLRDCATGAESAGCVKLSRIERVGRGTAPPTPTLRRPNTSSADWRSSTAMPTSRTGPHWSVRCSSVPARP